MSRTIFGRRGLALIAAAGSLVVAFIAGGGSFATATQGQPVIAGQINSETRSTVVDNAAAFACPSDPATSGLAACGDRGIEGVGDLVGVYGRDLSTDGATAVFGQHFGTTGIGVHGQTGGVGSGVYGEALGSGVGVYGEAKGSGTGVIATSASGISLSVRGKVQLSRSGTATIAGTSASPKGSVVVSNVALSAKSMVLVTAQKNVAGVWVRAAVPNVAGNSITIYLNKNVTTSMPVAWMVVEKP